jgi:hypothetical protein
MQHVDLFWVICLTLLLVIGLNVLIYVALKGKNAESMAEVLRRFSKCVRNPWEEEDATLSELSELVTGLSRDGSGEQEKDE